MIKDTQTNVVYCSRRLQTEPAYNDFSNRLITLLHKNNINQVFWRKQMISGVETTFQSRLLIKNLLIIVMFPTIYKRKNIGNRKPTLI